MNCNHEWLVPSHKRTRCKRCGDDGWVSYDGKVHETYEACMNHDALSYGARPLSLPQKLEPESSNEKVFKVPESGHYLIGDQTVYLDAGGSFKIKVPTQSGHEQTQSGHSPETTQVAFNENLYIGKLYDYLAHVPSDLYHDDRKTKVKEWAFAQHVALWAKKYFLNRETIPITSATISYEVLGKIKNILAEAIDLRSRRPDVDESDYEDFINWQDSACEMHDLLASLGPNAPNVTLCADNESNRCLSCQHIRGNPHRVVEELVIKEEHLEERIAALTAENERLKKEQHQCPACGWIWATGESQRCYEQGVFEAPVVEVDHWAKKAIDLEAKLKLATDFIEMIEPSILPTETRMKRHETLAKVKERK